MDLAGDILYRFCHAPTTLLLSISPLRPAIKRVLRSSIFLVYNMNMKNKLETRKGIIDKIAHHFLKLGCISRRRDLRKKPQCSAITQALFPSPLAVLPRMYPILSPLLRPSGKHVRVVQIVSDYMHQPVSLSPPPRCSTMIV